MKLFQWFFDLLLKAEWDAIHDDVYEVDDPEHEESRDILWHQKA